ncbi:murein hydrolase activator EnvC family protein [Aquimarina spongiae]|uniref:Septal ring factor EnvC, activator of murein hydrolases AmiA and AmiB n=1 Tax=Aquimarina spongiae TaxID=570521 RepID=A0A1M6F7J2_9FLAO|nr:peptidoglycan DD-metalloendopeptidase family protein [Aquimarina spongiae]SHI93549.1 Septal ring factor EnvC, activator of murein hydrolases AmiA and AmiB [Aquimarina spongiae]
MKVLRFISVVVLLLCVVPMYAQSTKQQKLEEERQRLRQEIEQMRRLREENKVKELSVLDEVESISAQISTRQNLIKITNQQTNLLTREINSNLNKIDTYRNELKVLKEDYANMVKKSYKSKSHQSRIMFLLSSSNFTQAYKRLQYMKQYNEHRKEQADRIEKNTMELQQLNRNLSKQKEDKETLISENREAQEKLKGEKKEQQVLMASIKKKQGVYTKQIKKKQERASAIDKQIEKLIREAIARANKKAGNKVAKKGTATTFAMTAEAKILADNFTSNKGKLPWPVGTGRLTKKYGRQPHPTLPNIQINSSGVEIETRSGERARAIFEGEVIAIQKLKGASRLVQIRHGNYITTYYNLHNISVKEGQKVTTKQSIGEVRTNPTTGRAIMKFLIYQNAKRLNPHQWIYRM